MFNNSKISDFKVDESTNGGNTIAGRKLAKRSSSFLNVSKPLSGFKSKGSSSY